MQGNIQAFALLLLGDAEPNGHIDDLQNDETRRESINDGHGNAFQLNEHGAVQTADLLAGEYAGEQRADNAADSVHAERVQRVVVAQGVLEGGCCNEAYGPATIPMITAGVGPTKPDAGVMATNPAT